MLHAAKMKISIPNHKPNLTQRVAGAREGKSKSIMYLDLIILKFYLSLNIKPVYALFYCHAISEQANLVKI